MIVCKAFAEIEFADLICALLQVVMHLQRSETRKMDSQCANVSTSQFAMRRFASRVEAVLRLRQGSAADIAPFKFGRRRASRWRGRARGKRQEVEIKARGKV